MILPSQNFFRSFPLVSLSLQRLRISSFPSFICGIPRIGLFGGTDHFFLQSPLVVAQRGLDRLLHFPDYVGSFQILSCPVFVFVMVFR